MTRAIARIGGVVGPLVILVIAALLVSGCQTGADDPGGAQGDAQEGDGASVERDGADGSAESRPPADEVVTGSGELTSREVDVAGVRDLLVGVHFEVGVTVGDTEQATIHMDDNLTDLVDYRVSGEQFRLGLKPGTSVRNATLTAEVTVRELSQITATGASQVTLLSPLTGADLALTTSGTSQLTGPVEVERLSATAAGASLLELSGHAGHLSLNGAGTSGLRLADLAVRELDAELSGTSCAVVQVSDTLTARASGASVLSYRGSPRVLSRDTSGVATIGSNAELDGRCASGQN